MVRLYAIALSISMLSGCTTAILWNGTSSRDISIATKSTLKADRFNIVRASDQFFLRYHIDERDIHKIEENGFPLSQEGAVHFYTGFDDRHQLLDLSDNQIAKVTVTRRTFQNYLPVQPAMNAFYLLPAPETMSYTYFLTITTSSPIVGKMAVSSRADAESPGPSSISIEGTSYLEAKPYGMAWQPNDYYRLIADSDITGASLEFQDQIKQRRTLPWIAKVTLTPIAVAIDLVTWPVVTPFVHLMGEVMH